ncbi:hypothetical protein [Desulfovibrio inopinatus]|uniref:hypothetical protein n=1 Tax=Desulfovibrio inopinatus TaxID=102109 RepID=UPI0004246903|nr:hypothetical protein [Desulfovibrio inopinatus]
MTLHIKAGVQQFDLPKVLSNAHTRIILHAPPYGPFARNNTILHALESTLFRPDGPTLTALCLPDIHMYPWVMDFMRLLRPQGDSAEVEHELNRCRLFLQHFARNAPTRVRLLEMQVPPSLPLLIIDETVFFSHFAHSTVMTPDGFWCSVTAPVDDFMKHADQGTEPKTSDPVLRATFRIISECVHTISRAIPITM